MTDFAKGMAGAAVGMGSIGLMAESTKMLPKFNKKGKMKPVSTKKLFKGMTNVVVGSALLSGAGSMVNAM